MTTYMRYCRMYYVMRHPQIMIVIPKIHHRKHHSFIWWVPRCVRTYVVKTNALTPQTRSLMASSTGSRLAISEWQLAKLWWDDIIIQMGKYIPEFTFTVQRTWDGSKALQTSYVSYYCEPPKKVHRLHNYSLNHFQVCRWCFNTSPRTLPAWLVGNSSVCFWFLMYTYMTWILPIFKKN